MTDEKSQLERFKESAKQLEADASEDALDKIMGRLDLKKPDTNGKKD